MTATPARRSPWLLAQLASLTHGGARPDHTAGRAPVDVTRRSAQALLRRWPAAVSMTRTGAGSVARAIRALPPATAQVLTAGSLGLGAGLSLGRSPLIVKAIGVAPAILMGASMLRRRDRELDARVRRPGSDARADTELDRLDDDGSRSMAAPSEGVPQPV